TKSIDLDDNRLAPHVTVETHQRAGDETSHHADSILPAAVDGFQFGNPFDNHAAAARDHERDQAARERASHSRGKGDSPGNVGKRNQNGKKPSVERPDRVSRGMWHAGIEGPYRQFSAVLQ